MAVFTPKFFSHPVVKDLSERVQKGIKDLCIFTLMKAIICADNVYPSKRVFCAILDVGDRIGGHVWDFLIEQGILAEGEDGYSCLEWAKKEHFFESEKEFKIKDSKPLVERRPHVQVGERGWIYLHTIYTDQQLEEALDFFETWKTQFRKKQGPTNDLKCLATWVKNRILG